MESFVSLNCSQPVIRNSPSPTASIWQDVLAQAVTGEFMAAMPRMALLREGFRKRVITAGRPLSAIWQQ